ncbi:efflux transporter outer membrane subunit [Nissabacter sp. SGAir0207]|uniref:efflux transporter outer membrane subunit n=1 Tax=Nissabacter sp. SGAir0207 TaxID=2126321 RepID=UPI0010CD155B|nr:efflux transporter outer membrane subunit [Nissabacter sp. SGAir0207]QCR36106.1 RND transporter [Nissabacter sp. SGAir0207]
MTKPLRLSLLALVTLATLSGCTLEPHYDRPAMPVPANWNAPEQGASTATGADIGWKAFFNDAALQQLVNLTLANNRDLRVAALNVESAQAQFDIDRAALLPTISAGAGSTAAHLPGGLYNTRSTGPVTYHQYQANLGVTSYELDLFGRVRSLRDQGLETYLQTEATQRATQISLVAETVSGYLSLCADRDLLALAQQTVASQMDSYNLTKVSYEQGVATTQDLAQAETTVRTAQADVASYSRQVRQDINALNLLAGTTVPQSLIEGATLKRDWRFPAIPAGLPSDLLTRRPDIVAAEHALKAANANIGAARAAFFPSITLTGQGGTTSARLGDLFSGGTGSWSFMPSINLPIFDGGVNRANLTLAEVSKKVEVAQYEKAIQQAFEEVADGLAGQSTYQDELQARELDTAANQRNYDVSQLRYKQGVDNYLNVLVAQRSLYSAQQAEITTRLGQLNQTITLYKALGGGWKP